MEVKFVKLLESLNTDISETSKSIKDQKKQFDAAWHEYSEAVQRYQEEEDAEAKEAMLDELNTFERDLQQADDAICHKIKIWHKNKDVWAEKAIKLTQARKDARERKAGTPPPPAPVMGEPQSAPQPQQVVIQEPTPQPMRMAAQGGQVEEVREENSGSGWGWFLGFVAAALTLGVASKYFKNS